MTNDITETAEDFYRNVLTVLTKTKIPFMVGGTFAFRKYTGIKRKTKDLDIFVKAGDYTKLLMVLKDAGYKTIIHDSRWIAKAFFGKHYLDLIFATPSGIWSVDDSWFENAPISSVLGHKVKL